MEPGDHNTIVAAAVILVPLGSIVLALTSMPTPRSIRQRVDLPPSEPSSESDLDESETRSEARHAGFASFGYAALGLGLILQVMHTLEANPVSARGWLMGGLLAVASIGWSAYHGWEVYRKMLNALLEGRYEL